jgi:hypothetical protein
VAEKKTSAAVGIPALNIHSTTDLSRVFQVLCLYCKIWKN